MSKKITPTAEMTPELIKGTIEIQVADDSKKLDPYMVPTDDDTEIDGGLKAYLRQPTDKELSYAMTKLPSVLDAGKVILKNCMIGGDERILNETALFNSAAIQCVELIEVRRTKLVKH